MIDRETYRRIYGTGYQNGRRDGAAEMRKEAAQQVEPYLPSIAAKIRALPLTPEEPA